MSWEALWWLAGGLAWFGTLAAMVVFGDDGSVTRHDRVRELLGQLSTDATLNGAWPELEDVSQYGTRRLLTAYERAESARSAASRMRGRLRYSEAVTELENALSAAALDARVLGNKTPVELLESRTPTDKRGHPSGTRRPSLAHHK